MLTDEQIMQINVSWETFSFPELKKRLQELYHFDMPYKDLLSALYWQLIDLKQEQIRKEHTAIHDEPENFTETEIEPMSYDDIKKYVIKKGMPVFDSSCCNCGGMCFHDDNYCAECGAKVIKKEEKLCQR